MEAFLIGLETFAIGMLIVFAVLFVLVGLLQLFSIFTSAFEKPEQHTEKTAVVDDIDEETVAIITAATAIVMKDTPYKIKSITKK